MTQTMYDAVTPANIPASATLVAGYIDGHYANITEMQARFPHAAVVRITVFASDNEGDVLDVENGDATPEQAPAWVVARRRAGHTDPAVYCNLSTWRTVIAAFRRSGIAVPLWWIADWDGVAELSAGMFAKQYAGTTMYDLSIVAGPWPGVQTSQEDTMTPADINAVADAVVARLVTGPAAQQIADRGAYADLWWLDHALAGTTTAQMSTTQATLIASLHRDITSLLAINGGKPMNDAADNGTA